MGRSPCCDKVGLKKGPWTPEEDQKLLAYVEEHGHGNWRALPSNAGLQRCGKSCRLRWTNYLRPDIKRGKFSLQEEQTIIQLHALLGNRWSAIATHLPKRTDNEIKNYWNTHLKKRLSKMGIDPVTHKPKGDTLVFYEGQSKNAANLSHIAQWESARLEAEARLVRQSKLLSNPPQTRPSTTATSTRCLDVVRALQQGPPWANTSTEVSQGVHNSPSSTLSSSENLPVVSMPKQSSTSGLQGINSSQPEGSFIEGFTELLLCNFSDRNLASDDGNGGGGRGVVGISDDGDGECFAHEDSKSYWNTILNLVSSSPSSSPLF